MNLLIILKFTVFESHDYHEPVFTLWSYHNSEFISLSHFFWLRNFIFPTVRTDFIIVYGYLIAWLVVKKVLIWLIMYFYKNEQQIKGQQ